MPAKHFTVHGRVQGVFFRASTVKKATELGITGWVRNMPNGTVEVHAEGTEENLRILGDWLHEGPETARVDSVATKDVALENCKVFSVQ